MSTKQAADLAGMRDDYAADQSERGSGIPFFRPESGKNAVRILPPHEEAHGRFIVRGGVHWGVGEAAISCPVAYRVTDSCWLCKRVDVLMSSDDKADQREGRDLRVRPRYLVNMFDVEDAARGILVWEFGRQVYDQIMKYVGDDDYGDISDPNDGYDLVLEKSGRRLRTTYSLRARKSSSGIPDEIWERLDAGDLNVLSELRDFQSDEEMQEAYEGTLTDDDDPGASPLDEEDDEDGAHTSTPHRRTPTPTVEVEEDSGDDAPPPARRTPPGRPIPSRGSARGAVDAVLERRRGRE